MPAFDPVRDAVLNSPISQSLPLPFPRSDTAPVISFPSPANPNNTHMPTNSPSDIPRPLTATSHPSPVLNRRATDLAVLLNSGPAPESPLATPLFTPTAESKPFGLSQLLLPVNTPGTGFVGGSGAAGAALGVGGSAIIAESREDDKLAAATPLSRRSTVSSTSAASPEYPPDHNRPGSASTSYFSIRPPSSHSHSSSSRSPLITHKNASGPSANVNTASPSFAHTFPTTGATPTRSPVASTTTLNSRPSSSASTPASHPHPRYDPVHSSAQPFVFDRSPRQFTTNMPPPPPPAPQQAPPQNTQRQSDRSRSSSASLSPIAISKPKPLLYAPRHRITPAGSVLAPLTAAEVEMYANLRGAQKLRKKRKREDDDDGGGVDFNSFRAAVESATSGGDVEERPKKRVKDVALIAGHYNARPDVGPKQRLQSPIIGLKAFNNWIKSVLITKFAHQALVASPFNVAGEEKGGRGGGRRGPGTGGNVLDMGCGKGGDLVKWSKAKVGEYFGLDIAAISVDQARARHSTMHPNSRFRAQFHALDCYTHPISSVLPLLASAYPPSRSSVSGPAMPFDVVSLQFCMHYAFESEKKARCMLDNVSRYLRPGGVFIGTVPNAELLLQRLSQIPTNASEFSFGNSVYSIRFEDRRPKAERPVFGDRYWFFLRDAVENVPEYVVQWDNFISLAAEYSLYPKYKAEFHQVFSENQHDPEFGPLMVRMKVVDAKGESQMDEDQWEAANIYIAFALEKR
ncbi:hypothetical protein JAAARDRAFT_33115 [Jaapia argillacea MUCL 33604]|uniref:mRNA cap guanine-N(7) methyltransferase n=1 Tax=Jaapia argillacea MUCL 33604 TaxID=933084 RepID=A0A067PXJ0_9AGAM|nr:hypothetical protein JAAARDRAFT_33115 [Jaapia argillacea MUCL 33604]